MKQNKIINSDISLKQAVDRNVTSHSDGNDQTKNNSFGFVKNLFCKGLGIILPIWTFSSGAVHAEVYLKNIGSEPVYILRMDYNIYGRKWHRDGWYKISPGKWRAIEEGCCNKNPVMPWQRQLQSYVIIRDKNYKILKYNWAYGKAGRSVCINPRGIYDEYIDLSSTVSLFDRLTWPSKYSKCAKGETRTKWVYEIPDRANIEKTITVRSH